MENQETLKRSILKATALIDQAQSEIKKDIGQTEGINAKLLDYHARDIANFAKVIREAAYRLGQTQL